MIPRNLLINCNTLVPCKKCVGDSPVGESKSEMPIRPGSHLTSILIFLENFVRLACLKVAFPKIGILTSYVENGTWYEKIFLPKCLSDPVKQLYPWSRFHKNNVKGLKIAKKCQKVAFFCISYMKHPYKGRFAKT